MGAENPRPARSSGQKSTKRGESPRWRAPLLPGAEPQLPPTAQRLLDAAHRLLVRSGYNSLSVEAIGQEAGENKALIRYYFGSKNGLLVALTDSLISDTLRQARQRLSGLSDTHDRVGVVADTAADIVGRRGLVPAAVRSAAPAAREPAHDPATGRPLPRLPGGQRPLPVGRPPGRPARRRARTGGHDGGAQRRAGGAGAGRARQCGRARRVRHVAGVHGGESGCGSRCGGASGPAPSRAGNTPERRKANRRPP